MEVENNLKILQLIDSLQVGGAEMMAVTIANALATKGFKSYLIATRKEGPLKEKINPEVTYLFLHKKNALDFNAIITLRNFIKKESIDIIHAHSTSFFIATLVKRTFPQLKIVWHDHYGKSESLEKRSSFMLKSLSPYFNASIAVNQKLKEWGETVLKIPKVYQLPNFVPTEQEVTKITVLKGIEHKRLVCIANLRPQKNHFNLLQAFKMSQETHSDGSLHLVGLDLNDSYSKEVKEFIATNHLENNVFTYGMCTDIPNILSQATIGVLASDSEGLPLALLEYGRAKLGVVVTDVGDCKQLIEEGVSGMLVPPKNPHAIAKKLVFLMENEKERGAMGAMLHQKVLATHSETVVINQLAKVYRELE